MRLSLNAESKIDLPLCSPQGCHQVTTLAPLGTRSAEVGRRDWTKLLAVKPGQLTVARDIALWAPNYSKDRITSFELRNQSHGEGNKRRSLGIYFGRPRSVVLVVAHCIQYCKSVELSTERKRVGEVAKE